MRKEFTAKIRVAAWQRSGGRCEKCTRKLYPGDVRFEHINPDGLTGEPTLENCGVYCRSCWQMKTVSYDIPQVAKAKRRERKHLGIRPRQSRPMPGSRASGWRKKMSGEVVRR